MAITRLERKGRKNISRAKNRVSKIKQLSAKPVIKNIDIEEIKKEFAANLAKPAKTAKAAEAPKAEVAQADAPKAEAPVKKVKAKKEEVAGEEKPKKKATKKTTEE